MRTFYHVNIIKSIQYESYPLKTDFTWVFLQWNWVRSELILYIVIRLYLRSILKGAELPSKYGGNWLDNANSWFGFPGGAASRSSGRRVATPGRTEHARISHPFAKPGRGQAPIIQYFFVCIKLFDIEKEKLDQSILCDVANKRFLVQHFPFFFP